LPLRDAKMIREAARKLATVEYATSPQRGFFVADRQFFFSVDLSGCGRDAPTGLRRQGGERLGGSKRRQEAGTMALTPRSAIQITPMARLSRRR